MAGEQVVLDLNRSTITGRPETSTRSPFLGAGTTPFSVPIPSVYLRYISVCGKRGARALCAGPQYDPDRRGDNRGKRYGNARRENGLRRGDSSPPAHGSRLTHFEIARLGIPRMQAHLGVIGRFEIERRIASFGNSKSGALPGRQSDRISAVRVRHNAGRLTAAPAAASTPINAIRAPKFSISVPMSKLSTNAPATDGGNPPSAPTAALDWRRISFG